MEYLPLARCYIYSFSRSCHSTINAYICIRIHRHSNANKFMTSDHSNQVLVNFHTGTQIATDKDSAE